MKLLLMLSVNSFSALSSFFSSTVKSSLKYFKSVFCSTMTEISKAISNVSLFCQAPLLISVTAYLSHILFIPLLLPPPSRLCYSLIYLQSKCALLLAPAWIVKSLSLARGRAQRAFAQRGGNITHESTCMHTHKTPMGMSYSMLCSLLWFYLIFPISLHYFSNEAHTWYCMSWGIRVQRLHLDHVGQYCCPNTYTYALVAPCYVHSHLYIKRTFSHNSFALFPLCSQYLRQRCGNLIY